VPSSSEGGLETWAYFCAPVVDDPVARNGDCTRDPETCNDDCEAYSFCHPETQDGQGQVCVGTCSGNNGFDQSCVRDEACVGFICWPLCDPFDPQCPAGASTCIPVEDQRIACVPWPAGNIGAGEPCGGISACQEGLVCVDAEEYGAGCDGPGCCTPLCDLTDGDPGCSGPEHVCLPYYVPGEVPDDAPGYDTAGFCGLPSAHPCLTHPGACPPDGIDDTYPWCSPFNFNACPDEDWRLRFYDCLDRIEPSGCACDLPCMDAGDCPVPATGTAVVQCEDTVLEVGSCMLSCAGGETCPDGMTCSDVVSGECVWVSPVPEEAC
jgi:hypothetical protein